MIYKMPELISLMFDVRTQAHKFHLQSKSYSQHIALGSFYDSLVDLADSLAEDFQGREGIITSYPKCIVVTSDPIRMIESFRSWIDRYRRECSDYSEHQNTIDSIQTLNNSTIYKLTNLR